MQETRRVFNFLQIKNSLDIGGDIAEHKYKKMYKKTPKSSTEVYSSDILTS